ncbi:ENV1 protein, partial [Zosterops hypoxanthus]|nr:ENV1 protein [Zosterops hypoxanthus]
LPQTFSTLWKIMGASFEALNKTHPELTNGCWLCYDIKPPFYEAIGTTARIKRKNGTNPGECLWRQGKNSSENVPGITMTHVTGKGTCVG